MAMHLPTDFIFLLARWAPMQPATIDLTLDLCTRYPLRPGGLTQCGIQRYTRHFYTWPALGIEPQTFWSWVYSSIHLAMCEQHYNSCTLFNQGDISHTAPVMFLFTFPTTVTPFLSIHGGIMKQKIMLGSGFHTNQLCIQEAKSDAFVRKWDT